ncbi:MAG: hypothetical protein IKX22_00010 [Prevotella sp.]|nr:hypothetical protein [Prevotella sp.]
MTQIDDFFMYENRVEGITDADYQRAQPYVEAAQAFAYIIVVKRILYALVLLLFFGCKGGTYHKSLEEIDTLADSYPAQARVFLNRADSNENKAYYKLLDIKILSNQKSFIHDYQDAVEECARLYEAKGDTAGLMRALYYKAVLWHEYYGDTATAVNLLLRIDSLGSAYSGSHDDRNMALVYDKLCKMGHTTYIGKLREASMLAGDSLLLARSLVYEAIATDRTHLADEAFAIVERCSPVKPQKARGELCTEYVQALIDKSAPDSVIMRYLPEIATQNPIGYTTASQYLYEHSHPDFSKDYLLRHGPDVFDIGNHRTVFASPSTYALLSNMYYVALKDGDKQAADSIQRELRQIEYVFDKEENYRENKEIGLMYEGGNTRFRYMKAQTYVMYGIIGVLLLLLAFAWWHIRRIRRANRMIASLNASVHQLKDVENPALSEQCDTLSHEIDNQLRRLKRRETDIANYKEEIAHLENISQGLMIYSQILQNRNISQIGRQGINQFLDSFHLIDESYSQYLSELDLNPSSRLLCILYHIGKTDDEVMQILQYTLANIRVRKSRIKADSGVESFDDLITK